MNRFKRLNKHIKKHLIGIFFLSIGIGVNSMFGHLARQWATIKIISLLFYLAGLSFICFTLISKLGTKINTPVIANLFKWILKRPFIIYLAMIPMIFSLFSIGQTLNKMLKHYYLQKNTTTINAVFIGVENQSFNYRFKKISKGFLMFEYHVEDESSNRI